MVKKIKESKGNYIDFGELSDLLDKYGIGIIGDDDINDTTVRVMIDQPYNSKTMQAEKELKKYDNISEFRTATYRYAPETTHSYFYFTYPNDELEESYGRKNEAKENEYGEKLYRVYVRTGTAWNDVREVYAYNEQEAIDKVVDRLEKEESNLVVDYYDIYDMCDTGETVDEFAEANDLICAGNHGLYIGIDRVELVED